MTASHGFATFHLALVFLGAAAVVVPVFHRLRLSPVIGFILVGLAVGPHGLGALPSLSMVTISDPEAIAPAAELGVSMLMFMIGLELSFRRLLVLRRLVFGLGSLQLVVCAGVLWAGLWAWGRPAAEAVVLGLAAAMSSTAVVLQVLAEARRMAGPVGRGCFAVLLFQDLAVIPVLFAIGVLGQEAGGQDAPGQQGGGMGMLALAIGQAALAVLLLVGLGRLALRPLFRSVARTQSPELFVAACLLVVIGTSLATAWAGLSMALGALVAGMLLAETEYRRQVEVTIEPFKGLLLGVFLVSVGMGLDLGRIAADPLAVLGTAAALVAVKTVVVAGLSLGFGLGWRSALQAGLLLGPGGEFGFVILGAAVAGGLVSPDVAGFTLLLVALSMATIPGLFWLGRLLERRAPVDAALLAPAGGEAVPRVIVAGFGRVGETVAAMLDTHGVPYVAIDSDPDRVAAQRSLGRPVYWGDITQVELLRRLHVANARALVVTMNDTRAADTLVRAARDERPELVIVSRARDAGHAAHLYQLGATDAVAETIEASLQLAEAVLVDVGVAMGPVIASIHEQRAAFQAEIRAMAPQAQIRPLGRRRLRDAAPEPQSPPRVQPP